MDETKGRVTILPAESDSETGGATGGVVPLRYRHDGWTPLRQRAFLRALAETGCLRQACSRVKMSKTSAYRLRDRDAGFKLRWDRALQLVAPILEHAAFERAVEGWEEPVWYHGKLLGYRRRYSDLLLRTLLLRGAAWTLPEDTRGSEFKPHKKTRKQLDADAKEAATRAGGYFWKQPTVEKVNSNLGKVLDSIERRMKAEEARKAKRAATKEAAATGAGGTGAAGTGAGDLPSIDDDTEYDPIPNASDPRWTKIDGARPL